MGVFWNIDKDGYLVNDAGVHKIQPEFTRLVDVTRRTFIEGLGHSMHSCYLTGSVPRGVAVGGISDLDAFAILNEGEINSRKKQLYRAISSLRLPEVTDVQMEVWGWRDLFQDEMNCVTEHQVILKLDSLCIFGTNLAKRIAPIRADVALANTEIVQFRSDVDEMLCAIDKNGSSENVAFWSRRIIKNLIRALFYMTIPREKKFTRDLDLSVQIFLKNYPGRTEILKSLEILNAPFSRVPQLREYFKKGFGKWVLEETEKWLKKYNPKRLSSLTRCA